MRWIYLSIPQRQRCYRSNLGMDKYFHPTLNLACDYISMLGLKVIHVSKRGPCCGLLSVAFAHSLLDYFTGTKTPCECPISAVQINRPWRIWIDIPYKSERTDNDDKRKHSQTLCISNVICQSIFAISSMVVSLALGQSLNCMVVPGPEKQPWRRGYPAKRAISAMRKHGG